MNKQLQKQEFALQYYLDAEMLSKLNEYPPVISTFLGDVVLAALGVDGSCFTFYKHKNGHITIGYGLSSGAEYMMTFQDETDLLEWIFPNGKKIGLKLTFQLEED